MIIITGGAGFIGSSVLSLLNEKGRNDIVIVDNLGKSEKWKNLVGKKYIEYIHKSIFLEKLKSNYFSKIEAIIHLGACSSTTELDADYLYSNNTSYTNYLIKWSLEHKIRFIYASSAATYGDGSLGFSDDNLRIPSYRPLNMYGYSKQLSDEFVLKNGLDNSVCGLRFFNVYGPNEYHKGSMTSVVYNSFKQIKESGRVKLFKSYKDNYADGEQKRDFIYVKDVANIIWWLLNNPQVNGIFNIGTGQARSWNDLVKAVFKSLNIEPNIEYIDMPFHLKEKYQYFTEADNKKIIDGGWEQGFTALEKGVADYVNNYLDKDFGVY